MSPASAMPTGTKSPPELQEAFASAMDTYPEAERRKMFGYPAAFANGNMWTGLHQDRWVIRLPEHHLNALMEHEGALPFEPIPGRAMSGFCVLPQAILDDPDRLHEWLSRGFEHALSMEPKPARGAKSKA
jgi:TfoX/Sxy family transcriptional regulator of competence genes